MIKLFDNCNVLALAQDIHFFFFLTLVVLFLISSRKDEEKNKFSLMLKEWGTKRNFFFFFKERWRHWVYVRGVDDEFRITKIRRGRVLV